MVRATTDHGAGAPNYRRPRSSKIREVLASALMNARTDCRFPAGAEVTLAQLDRDPHPVHERLRAREPVSWIPALDAWLVTRRDLVLLAARDPDAFTVDDERFSTGRVVGPSMLTLDGDEHRRNRDPFARAFRLSATREQFTAFTIAETDALIDRFAARGAAELRRELAGPLAVAVMARALGLDPSTNASVLAWYATIVQAVTDVAAGAPVSEPAERAFELLRESIDPVLDGDREASLLASAARDAEGLTREQIISNAAVLLFGGIETTEGMILNAVAHLLGDTDQLAQVSADRHLIGAAVEESLRLEPAAAVIDRYATRDLELGGAQIRSGDLVTLSLAAANRDPAVFADPHRFDLRRENSKLQLAFAQGPHVCLGMHLARLETATVLELLLGRLPGLRLDTAHDPAPRGLVFRKPPSLHVLWRVP